LVDFESFWGTPLFLSIQFLMTIAALAVLAFYSYLFLVREHHDPLLRLFHALGVRYPKTGSLERIYMGLRHYHNHRWTVIKVLLVSICIHLLVGWACFRLAMAMGDVVSQLAVYVVTPIGLLVTAIPVLPAGVGTGHAAFSILFKLIGSLRGADVFTLFVLFHLFIGSVGGLVYLRFRNTEPKLNFDSAALDADTLSPTTTR
jgi:glycosyltransferase 2 family protein